VPERLPELGVVETLLDLRALAVKVFDLGGGLFLGRDVGDDERVGVGGVKLPAEHHRQLLGRDRLAPPGTGAGRLDLLGGDRDPADDQPERLVLSALGGER